MQYEWIKQGQNYIRVPILVNTWNCSAPVEDEIKKPTHNK